MLTALAKEATVVGVDYIDRREQALSWLGRHGDPFHAALFDSDGRLAVKPVPATAVIDKRGVVRYRHTGPVTAEIAARKIVPLLRELERR